MTEQLATTRLESESFLTEQRSVEAEAPVDGGPLVTTGASCPRWQPPALDRARLEALCDQVDGRRLDALRALVHAAVREPRRG